MCVRFFFSYVAIALLAGVAVQPATADDLESLLSGFEDEPQERDVEPVSDRLNDLLEGFAEESSDSTRPEQGGALLPDWLKISGSVGLQSTVNFSQSAPPPDQPDYRGVSMLKGFGELISDISVEPWWGRLGVSLFYDGIYRLKGQRSLYTENFLDLYEAEFEIDEAYLGTRLGPKIDLKVGRQIVVWGKSDNIRVTDILNPLDLRWPGLLDIRFLRMPVTMTKLDIYQGNWNVEGILVNEPRFNKLPVYNGEFFPFKQAVPEPEEPGWSLSNQQAALALNGIFSGWDVSFYAAHVFDQQPYFSDLQAGVREYEKVFFAGFAANVALGNWLLKGEAAWWDGLRYSNIDDPKSRLDFLVGADYSGFSETTVSIEYANRHIFDFDERIALAPDGQKEDWNQLALRFTRNFLNDTLHLTMLVSSYGLFAREGGFERFQLEYDIKDNLSITGGIVFYQSGDFPSFKDIGDNDRLLLKLDYRF